MKADQKLKKILDTALNIPKVNLRTKLTILKVISARKLLLSILLHLLQNENIYIYIYMKKKFFFLKISKFTLQKCGTILDIRHYTFDCFLESHIVSQWNLSDISAIYDKHFKLLVSFIAMTGNTK